MDNILQIFAGFLEILLTSIVQQFNLIFLSSVSIGLWQSDLCFIANTFQSLQVWDLFQLSFSKTKICEDSLCLAGVGLLKIREILILCQNANIFGS